MKDRRVDYHVVTSTALKPKVAPLTAAALFGHNGDGLSSLGELVPAEKPRVHRFRGEAPVLPGSVARHGRRGWA
jgi:hypothetical protein